MTRTPGAAPVTRRLAIGALVVALEACAEPARTSANPAPAAATPAAVASATPAPSTAGVTSSVAPSASPSPPATPPVVDAITPTPGPTPKAAKAPTADAGSGAESLVPELLATDGTPLPQTRDRPSVDSPSFKRRLELLVAAIAHDDPERALPAFFPRVAYEQVKGIAKPGRDWEQRLIAAFRRNIHEYHQLLGREAPGVGLAALVLDERRVRWMDPGTEGNRLGYHRVTRSRLRLRLASGTERELELTSLISWRGEWYVVHLHGFG